MTDEELIESLRLWNRDDAADRIEALTAEVDMLTANKNAAHYWREQNLTRAEKAEAERDAAVEALEKSEIMFRIRGQNSMADEVSTTIAKIKEGKL